MIPLKNASKTEKAIHGSWIVALIVGLLPLFQTMWVERPWWAQDRDHGSTDTDLGAADTDLGADDVWVEAPTFDPEQKSLPAWPPVDEQVTMSAPPPESGFSFQFFILVFSGTMAVFGLGMTFLRKRMEAKAACGRTTVA